MLSEGDKVVIRKPVNTEEFPYWMDGMDKFDGAEVTVSGIETGQYGTTFDHKGYLFSVNWIEGAGKNNIATQPKSPTLLDQFAMHALTGLCAYPGRENETNGPEHFAEYSYALAQAMLKARPQ